MRSITRGVARQPTCGGEERSQLDCQCEFSYDGQKIEGGVSAIGLGGRERGD